MTRRLALGGAMTAAATLGLVACEGGGGSNSAGTGSGRTTDLEERSTSGALEDLIDTNPQNVEDLEPIITYTLNPDATWNDGTPYDWKTFGNQWRMRSGEDPEIDTITTEGYRSIESVEAGEDDRQVVVRMKEVHQPWTGLFSQTLHPAINTAEIFNNGFVNELNPQWLAGPFTLEDLDMVQRRVTMVPNENWWDQPPLLDAIVYREMEAGSTLPSFRNQEIDEIAILNVSRYNELADYEAKNVRRSQALSVSGLNFNTTRGVLQEIEVRKAICQDLDRHALTDLRFNGLAWTEELPGSWMLMPFSPHYQDNYPFEHDKEAAKRTLEDAGWVAEGDGPRTRDGETLSISVTNFGDDPLGNAISQTIQANLTELGFDATIDAKGTGDFAQVMADRSFELVMMGYGAGNDPTTVVQYFFGSDSSANMTGAGSDEIDALIPTAFIDPEIEDRAAIADEVEKMFQELYCMMPLWNGPSITAYTPGPGSFGPQLFESRDWSIVGWEKGHKQG